MAYLSGILLIILGIFCFALAAALPAIPIIIVIIVFGSVLKGIAKIFK
ncbi:hypothetical protein [Butyrivibrio fibrisolvens]|nr:hypothetical protein [Butyrivibrio fibrisolvens]